MMHHNTIETCRACAASCENCAEIAMLDGNELCSLICQDAAAVCAVCAQMQERHSPFAADMCRLCAQVCAMCAEECRKLSVENDNYFACADACEQCATECGMAVA